MRKTVGLLGIFWIAAFLPLVVAMPAHACSWTLYAMYQDGTLRDGFWWKPIRTVKSPEACRAMVKLATGRPITGLISWYHFPALTASSPAWIQEVVAGQPKGGPEPWIGCLPNTKDYDPHERR